MGFEFLTPRPESRLLRISDVLRVTDILRHGGVAVLPTETGYMIAAAATSEAAVRKVFAAKSRSLSNTMHVACSSLEMAENFSEITPLAARLLGDFTPGPLTVVVRKNSRLPDSLVTVNGTVGIRVPDHPATLQIIAAVGEPVTATSLNAAGESPSGVDLASLELLNWPPAEVVPVVRDPQAIRFSDASTLVRVAGTEIEMLRRGPISEEEISKTGRSPSKPARRRTGEPGAALTFRRGF